MPVVTILNNPVVVKAGKPKIVQVSSDMFDVRNVKEIPAGNRAEVQE